MNDNHNQTCSWGRNKSLPLYFALPTYFWLVLLNILAGDSLKEAANIWRDHQWKQTNKKKGIWRLIFFDQLDRNFWVTSFSYFSLLADLIRKRDFNFTLVMQCKHSLFQNGTDKWISLRLIIWQHSESSQLLSSAPRNFNQAITFWPNVLLLVRAILYLMMVNIMGWRGCILEFHSNFVCVYVLFFFRVHSHDGATFTVKNKTKPKKNQQLATFIFIFDGDNLGIISENVSWYLHVYFQQ